MTFELLLPEERVKPHQVMALHLMAALAMAGSGAVLKLFYPPAAIWSLVLAIAGVALLLYALFRNKQIIKPAINRTLRVMELLVLGGLALFFTYMRWTPPAVVFGILTAAVVFAIFWESGQGKGQIILIDGDGIKLPASSRRRSIIWPEIERVILRHGILTIDCVDNRLYQWNIGNPGINTTEFDSFCFAHIEAGKKKRVKDW
jgi:hypothetical protein